jgi:hypothetical protein
LKRSTDRIPTTHVGSLPEARAAQSAAQIASARLWGGRA